MNIDISRFISRFQHETRENLSVFDALLTRLSQTCNDETEYDRTLTELMRITHAIKGSARMLGFSAFNHLSHALEGFLTSLRQIDHASQMHINLIADVRRCFDDLLMMTSEEAVKPIEEFEWLQKVIQRLNSTSVFNAQEVTDVEKENGKASPASDLQTSSDLKLLQHKSNISVNINDINRILTQCSALTVTLGSLKNIRTSLDYLRKSDSKHPTVDTEISSKVKALNPNLENELSSIINDLNIRIADLDSIISKINSSIVALRMKPISELFDMIPLQVRELADALGREVEVVFSGESVQFDGWIIEQLREPILHIIRNSLDHGLEPTEEREQKGKSPVGRITIGAFEHAGQARIVIADDGRGIDLTKVWQRAKELGITEDSPAFNNLAHGYGFLFDTRFSSRDTATNISGRGIGMAAVKRRLHELGGEVTIESTLDFGTRIVLTIPTSLASQKSLVVASRLDGRKFYIGLPQSLVREVVRVKKSEDIFFYDKRSYSTTVSLIRLLDGSNTPILPDEAITVICSDGVRDGSFSVEEIVAEMDVVIHPLPMIARASELVSGVAALNAEDMIFIFNVPKALTQLEKHNRYQLYV